MAQNNLKVFVSSTRVDLVEFRQAVLDALRRIGMVPLAMEDFGSRPADATTVCMREVEECDIFIGIYAFRYGYTTVAGGPSITEQEYLVARRGGKRCFCYFADDKLRPQVSDESHESDEKTARLAAFKQRIDRELVRSTFHGPEDLATNIATDLGRFLNGEPLGYTHQDLLHRWLQWEQSVQKDLLVEQLDDHSGVVTSPFVLPSPLLPAWEQFLESGPWHVEIADRLATLCAYSQHFAELAWFTAQVQRIDCTADYNQILAQLHALTANQTVDRVVRFVQPYEGASGITRPLSVPESDLTPGEEQVRTAQNLRHELFDLQHSLTPPNFRRCFLVLGELGAGKTHFLASVLADDDEIVPADEEEDIAAKLQTSASGPANPDETGYSNGAEELPFDSHAGYLLLPLEAYWQPETLDIMILNAINAASGLSWQSLTEFDAFLHLSTAATDSQPKNENARDARQAQTDTRPLWRRLVIAIDDLQRWIAAKPTFLDELTTFISQHTRLPSLYWMLTLQDTSYSEVASKIDFWAQYSLVPPHVNRIHREWVPPQINGWLALNDLNREERLGVELIKHALAEAGKQGSVALELLDMEEGAVQQLNNPFLAWVLLDLQAELPLHTLVTLHYIEFVTQFWAKKFKQITATGLSPLIVQQFIDWTTQILFTTGELAPLTTTFLNKMTQLAYGYSELQERTRSQVVLNALVASNVLRLIRSPNPRSGPDVDRMQLRAEPFWQWQIAQKWQNDLLQNKPQVVAAQQALDAWFGATEDGQLRAGVLEFLLLLLDQALGQGVDAAYVTDLWRHSARSKQIPAASAWFAGPRASQPIQRLLADCSPDALNEPANQRLLFAYLYFLSESTPLVSAAPKRLELLQPHYAAINAASLSAYFWYVAERLLTGVTDNQIMLECMTRLAGCEVMGLAQELGQCSVDLLLRNAADQAPAIMPVLLAYLAASGEQVQREYAARGRGAAWRRYFYHEWVLHTFCDRLVAHFDHQDLLHGGAEQAYRCLWANDWYHPQQCQVRGPLALEMTREANIALGYSYRRAHSADRVKAFVSFVGTLVASADPRERENAFYIIRHTVPTAGEKAIKVNDEFRLLLAQLRNDRSLQRTVERYQEFFAINLDNG